MSFGPMVFYFILFYLSLSPVPPHHYHANNTIITYLLLTPYITQPHLHHLNGPTNVLDTSFGPMVIFLFFVLIF